MVPERNCVNDKGQDWSFRIKLRSSCLKIKIKVGKEGSRLGGRLFMYILEETVSLNPSLRSVISSRVVRQRER
jgi:hypothetical protein